MEPSTRRGRFAALVVDDDETIRMSFSAVLEDEGIQVFEAENGRVALAMLDAIPRPAVVVLDMMMPVMNGLEFLVELRSGPHRDLPVVVVSAFVDRAASAAANATLPKPVRPTVLLAELERLVSQVDEEASA